MLDIYQKPDDACENKVIKNKGTDLRYDLEITFMEAVFGTNKQVTVPHKIICSKCNGLGKIYKSNGPFGIKIDCPKCQNSLGVIKRTDYINVIIPPGVDTGSRLKVAGEGNFGGDLYVVMRVQSHSKFKRHENDILVEVPIRDFEAALGVEIEVPTIDGRVKMTIPEGTQSGKTFRMRGYGVPILGGYGRGNQNVCIIVETPTNCTPKQRGLLMELASISGENTFPACKNFIDRHF